MKLSASERLTDALTESGVVSEENKALYQYGFEQGAFMLLNLATTLAVGFLFGMIWQSILFTAVYIPLRSNAGGYHAKTPLKCYILSITIIAAALLAIRLFSQYSLVCCIMLMLGSTAIFRLAPVADNNKPLDETEIRVYRKRSVVLLTDIIGVFILFLVIGGSYVPATISIAVAVLGGMVKAGMIKNKGRIYSEKA